MKWLRTTAVLAVLVLAGFVAWLILSPSERGPEYKTQRASIKSIKQMVELCAADIHDEWAIKDSINGKWIVARLSIEGRIRFDLDSLRTEMRGDTMVVMLPPERVDIYETAGPDGYQVLDAWDGRNIIFPRTLTASEENALKERWQKKARTRIYRRGYVKEARKNAVASLTPLLNAMRGPTGEDAPILIIDPSL